MAWIRSHKKSSGGGGGTQLTKLIDWELYSHPSAFDSIAMPEDYTDYTHVILAITSSSNNLDFFDCLLEGAYKYYQDNGSLPTGYGNVFYILPTSSISASDINIDIPLLFPYMSWANAFAAASVGQTRINSSRILGYNYSENWSNLKLVMYGVNISS